MEKIYLFIKSRQEKVNLSDVQEESLSTISEETISLSPKPTRQVIAKTKKDKLVYNESINQ